jgi:hypothetical protein
MFVQHIDYHLDVLILIVGTRREPPRFACFTQKLSVHAIKACSSTPRFPVLRAGPAVGGRFRTTSLAFRRRGGALPAPRPLSNQAVFKLLAKAGLCGMFVLKASSTWPSWPGQSPDQFRGRP